MGEKEQGGRVLEETPTNPSAEYFATPPEVCTVRVWHLSPVASSMPVVHGVLPESKKAFHSLRVGMRPSSAGIMYLRLGPKVPRELPDMSNFSSNVAFLRTMRPSEAGYRAL